MHAFMVEMCKLCEISIILTAGNIILTIAKRVLILVTDGDAPFGMYVVNVMDVPVIARKGHETYHVTFSR